MALTTDIWTPCQTCSYCCATVHFITYDWKLSSAILETFEFNTDHTANNIAANLKRVANSWGIDNKVFCSVIDNVSNMEADIDQTGLRHLPCFTHTLKLDVQESIKSDD